MDGQHDDLANCVRLYRLLLHLTILEHDLLHLFLLFLGLLLHLTCRSAASWTAVPPPCTLLNLLQKQGVLFAQHVPLLAQQLILGPELLRAARPGRCFPGCFLARRPTTLNMTPS